LKGRSVGLNGKEQSKSWQSDFALMWEFCNMIPALNSLQACESSAFALSVHLIENPNWKSGDE
jgi:hypothetical protein